MLTCFSLLTARARAAVFGMAQDVSSLAQRLSEANEERGQLAAQLGSIGIKVKDMEMQLAHSTAKCA